MERRERTLIMPHREIAWMPLAAQGMVWAGAGAPFSISGRALQFRLMEIRPMDLLGGMRGRHPIAEANPPLNLCQEIERQKAFL
jgi:hypothetical protein